MYAIRRPKVKVLSLTLELLGCSAMPAPITLKYKKFTFQRTVFFPQTHSWSNIEIIYKYEKTSVRIQHTLLSGVWLAIGKGKGKGKCKGNGKGKGKGNGKSKGNGKGKGKVKGKGKAHPITGQNGPEVE